MTSIKAAIFDFGGVFTTSPVTNFAIYEQENGLPERFISGVIKANINDGPFAQYERAEIDLDAFDQAFADETRAAGHEVRGRTLVSLLSLTFRPDMIAALDRVKAAGFLTGCITNNMPSHDTQSMLKEDSDAQTLKAIFATFDHIIESSKVGVRKPEPRIYRNDVRGAGRGASSLCVFLDDLGINLKPAKAMGMQTIKVPFDDVSPAIEALEALLGL